MRSTLTVLVLVAVAGAAVAGPIYTTLPIRKSPEALEQERKEREREYRAWNQICDSLPDISTCRGPTTDEKILRELELMRKER